MSIRNKILMPFLGLSAISLVIFGYIVFNDLQKLGNYALKSSNALG